MYILSRPLVEWIVMPDNAVVQSNLVGHEDLMTGTFVHMSRFPVFKYTWHTDACPWLHPVKSVSNFFILKSLPRLYISPLTESWPEVDLAPYIGGDQGGEGD